MGSLALLMAMVAAMGGPRVERVENGGLLFTDNQAGVTGTDCGYSLAIGARTLWFFGDVFLKDPVSPGRESRGFLSNCALHVPAGRGAAPLRRYQFLVDRKTGCARPVLLNEPGETEKIRLWPLGGWYDAAGETAYLFYNIVEFTGEGGPFGFRALGHGLARASTRSLEGLTFTRLRTPGGSLVWWPAPGDLMGVAVVHPRREGETSLYVVGVRESSGRKHALLARVAPAEIADARRYQYYAGGDAERPLWADRVEEAAEVQGLADFPSELSVAYNPYLGGYLAVHTVGLSEKMRLSLAPHPWGPYRPVAEIAAPHQPFASSFCYAGKEHPELAEQGGRVIYVTYVDQQRYWLQLLKVTLAR